MNLVGLEVKMGIELQRRRTDQGGTVVPVYRREVVTLGGSVGCRGA